jgi:cutinase
MVNAADGTPQYVCRSSPMTARRIALVICAALATSWGLVVGPVPAASAQPCPDIEIVFARGTSESPGVGGIGQAFVDSLRSQVDGREVAVYPVNYPAASDFNNRIEFARTVVDGIRDAGTRVESMAANCPNTRMVLGGFSQGAVVAGYVTAAVIPEEIPPEFRPFIPNPMPPQVADHVAAVVLFGKPSAQFMSSIGAPPVVIGPLYAPKTLDLCIPDDTICNGAPAGGPSIGHALYAMNGMTNEGAAYAAGRL